MRDYTYVYRTWGTKSGSLGSGVLPGLLFVLFGILIFMVPMVLVYMISAFFILLGVSLILSSWVGL
jgi:hypothetical protein